MAPAIPVAFLLSRKFPKRIGLGKEHPTGKKIKRFLGGNRKLVSLKSVFLVDMPQAM
jgi:hypothetical protein